uniref:Reverse transcriptase Ty1/copia-type domain-containing protein n=1 Tax=Tanacetum cinerariifolium TaxID=118510 RepID=A0A6L2P311_TANCI|nr:hypothetical protein [Tanacetum cinerariifolium]
MAWTTFDTRYESAGISGTQELSFTDSLTQDYSIPDEQVHLSNDEDSVNDRLPKADSKKDWWKPLPEEERPATPEPAWTIPSSTVSDVENNWATALVSAYETPAENSLLAKTGDMTNFLNWYRRQVNRTALTPTDLEGQTYEVVKAFYPDVTHLYKGSSPTLLISKMKAASYPDFGLELLMPKQMWIDDVHDSLSHRKEVRSHIWILSVVRIKAYSRYGYDYLSKIVLRRSDLQEHMIAKKDFKNLYPSDFEDLNLLLLQGYEFKHYYTITESPRVVVFPVNNNERKIMRFNEIYKFGDGTLTRILEVLAYRVKEFKIKQLNPETFSPVADIRAIRILMAIAAYYDYEIWQLDVKIAFSNGYLDEDIYMVQLKGEATFILGIKIYRDRSKRLIRLGQNAYMDKILKRYKIDNSKRGHIPMQKRLDLNKTQGSSTPEDVKRIINVPYALASLLLLRCAGYETARDDIKSQIGYVFILNKGTVDWKSTKQSTTVMSATEAKYIVASEVAMEAIGIRKFISELGIVPIINELIKMFCDNSVALLIANESRVQKGARNYHRRYHYVCQCSELGEINLLKVYTDDNLAGPFTKALPKGKLTQHARSI